MQLVRLAAAGDSLAGQAGYVAAGHIFDCWLATGISIAGYVAVQTTAALVSLFLLLFLLTKTELKCYIKS